VRFWPGELGLIRAPKRNGPLGDPARKGSRRRKAIGHFLFYPSQLSETDTDLDPKTMKIIRALGGLALATVLFGLVQPGMAQFYGERSANPVTGTPSSGLRGQERTIPASPFQGRAEYPPPGYLAEFEENRGGRVTRAGESAGEFAPISPGGVPGSSSRHLSRPEFAPGGYDLQAPSPQPGGRDFSSHGEQRWSSRTGTPRMQEPSWPSAPSAGYPTRPEFASENREPGRHEPTPGPRGGIPAYPPQNPGWQY
jgi:hypothetical protein